METQKNYKKSKMMGFLARFCGVVFALILSAQLQAATRTITIEKDTATELPLDGKIGEIFVSNPEIADVQNHGQKKAYLYGKHQGVTTIILQSKSGASEAISVVVTHPFSSLRTAIAKVHPDEKVGFTSSPQGIVITGDVASPKASRDIEEIASHYLDKDEKVINNLAVTSPAQVYLRVKFAEVQRSVLNRLSPNWGLNVNSPGHFTYGVLTGRAPIDTATNLFVRDTTSTNAPFGSLGFRANDGVTDVTSLLDIFEQEGLATTLAEPNLIALSGETASFLAGGEYPFPVPQSNTSLSIEFKPFGISLAFTPTVLGSNMINLRVKPEVSDLDTSIQLSYPINGVAVSVPGLKTRKAETSVELASGQSFAIAGLLSSTMASTLTDLPGIGDLPIIGALFRSTNFQSKRTELVIIVTPYIVNPSSPKKLTLPTDGLKFASPLEMLLLKRLNRVEGRNIPSGQHLESSAGFYVE
ncbi:MAG: pilus assembly protein [Candidatus Puniceispirillum sp.]|nr:pilus assembly protein [Candidatus Puniceispirillum sp.]